MRLKENLSFNNDYLSFDDNRVKPRLLKNLFLPEQPVVGEDVYIVYIYRPRKIQVG